MKGGDLLYGYKNLRPTGVTKRLRAEVRAPHPLGWAWQPHIWVFAIMQEISRPVPLNGVDTAFGTPKVDPPYCRSATAVRSLPQEKVCQ